MAKKTQTRKGEAMTYGQKKVARLIEKLWPGTEIKYHDSGPGGMYCKVSGTVGQVSKHFPHPQFGVGIIPAREEGFCEIQF